MTDKEIKKAVQDNLGLKINRADISDKDRLLLDYSINSLGMYYNKSKYLLPAGESLLEVEKKYFWGLALCFNG